MAELLRLEGVARSFGGLRAVAGVDLALAEGEILGLIGPNGAGKTTLFNLIAGALAPEAGAIRFLGEAHRPTHPRSHLRAGPRPHVSGAAR